MSGLTIYKASAGSGKTHALVKEYLDLIFAAPSAFRHILAVTFTNKATAEMKQRILQELNALSGEGKSGFREFLKEKHHHTDESLKQTAGEILNRILQNYSRFYIETIDRFFQRVIRSFAREIQLQPAFTIEMSETRVLEAAVDRMLSEAGQDAFLSKWLGEFADQKILEGQNWNLKKDILNFSEQIFNEKFREHSEDLIRYLQERENIGSYNKELYTYKNWFESHLKELGERAMKIMENHGLTPSDFNYKEKGPAGFLERLALGIFTSPGIYARNGLAGIEGWYSKSSPRKGDITDAFHAGLSGILNDAMSFRDKYYLLYNSVEYARQYLFSLGILTDIMKKIGSYLDEKNVFLISDASYFIQQIIGGNDTPFIYEKTGNYFSHFMIDEFQDTSRMQWQNFKPLIENSLGTDHRSLVVGDVKQSIYRWRNSDWEILSEGIHSDFRKELMDFKTLTENRRSRENIITFNNLLFTVCRESMGEKFNPEEDQIADGISFREKLLRAYSDIRQDLPQDQPKAGGYVEVSFLETEEERDWKEKSDEKVIETIMLLQDRGYEPRDIAILVRKGEEGKRIADLLLKQKKMSGEEAAYRFDMISDDSLFLGGSSAIRLIVSILRFLIDPDEKINKAELINEYKRYLLPEVEGVDPDEIFRVAGKGSAEEFSGFMPEGFHRLSTELPYLSLNEITERIISLFSLHRRSEDLTYLHAFQDIIMEYSRNEPADISSFLVWWEEFGTEKYLTTSEGQNAIRVMTIHKAKGLQFRSVIIPYCDWSLDHKLPVILWCSPAVAPFNQISLVPVRYSSKLRETIFREDYLLERFRIHVDHMNLLYVALTRAQENLFVMVPHEPDKYEELKKVSDLVGVALTGEKMKTEKPAHFDPETLTWRLGEAGYREDPEKEKITTELILQTVSNPASRAKLRTHWHGTDFLNAGGERGINKGKIIHEVLQSMNTVNDLDRATEKEFRTGRISAAEMAEIRNEIKEFLNLEPVKDWFSGEWKVLGERDIITCDGHMKRPDRVMMKEDRIIIIDYKSGQAKRPEHTRQVLEYMNLVREMGHLNVTGYLCYIKSGEIIRIGE